MTRNEIETSARFDNDELLSRIVASKEFDLQVRLLAEILLELRRQRIFGAFR